MNGNYHLKMRTVQCNKCLQDNRPRAKTLLWIITKTFAVQILSPITLKLSMFFLLRNWALVLMPIVLTTTPCSITVLHRCLRPLYHDVIGAWINRTSTNLPKSPCWPCSGWSRTLSSRKDFPPGPWFLRRCRRSSVAASQTPNAPSRRRSCSRSSSRSGSERTGLTLARLKVAESGSSVPIMVPINSCLH